MGNWPDLIVEAGFRPATPALASGSLILGDAVYGLLGTGTLADGTEWTSLAGVDTINGLPIIGSVTVTRPSTRQQGPLVTYQAGTATITLNNSDARFSPENLDGPFVVAGQTQVRPMIPIRVRASWDGITAGLFSGFATSWTPPTAGLGASYDTVTVEASDGFYILNGVTLPETGTQGAGELSGARVRRVLAAAGWYDQARGMSVTGTGQSAVQGTTMGATALSLLQLTADSEIGELYVDGSGRVVFRDRHALLTESRSATVQAVFGDNPGTVHAAGTELAYTDISRPDDDTTMVNDVQATCQGGDPQQVTDAASVARYLFPRSYTRSDLILTSDPETLSWARYVAYLAANDESRFDQLTIMPDADPGSLYPQVLTRELGDRIQVWRRPPGQDPVVKDCFIRGITHTVTDNGWTTVWTLQQAARYSFLTLGNPATGVLGANALAF